MKLVQSLQQWQQNDVNWSYYGIFVTVGTRPVQHLTYQVSDLFLTLDKPLCAFRLSITSSMLVLAGKFFWQPICNIDDIGWTFDNVFVT